MVFEIAGLASSKFHKKQTMTPRRMLVLTTQIQNFAHELLIQQLLAVIQH